MGRDPNPDLRQSFSISAPSPGKPRRRPETKPFCLRFTQEERARIEAAGNLPLGTFIRNLVLGVEIKPNRSRSLQPVKD
jgi:hypothetical protein